MLLSRLCNQPDLFLFFSKIKREEVWELMGRDGGLGGFCSISSSVEGIKGEGRVRVITYLRIAIEQREIK